MEKQCVKNAMESVSSVDSDVIISYGKNTQVVALISGQIREIWRFGLKILMWRFGGFFGILRNRFFSK